MSSFDDQRKTRWERGFQAVKALARRLLYLFSKASFSHSMESRHEIQIRNSAAAEPVRRLRADLRDDGRQHAAGVDDRSREVPATRRFGAASSASFHGQPPNPWCARAFPHNEPRN